jgi:hypothetical protein
MQRVISLQYYSLCITILLYSVYRTYLKSKQYITMSNKLTQFIQKNTIALILIAIIVTAGITSLAFLTFNPSPKSNNQTSATKSLITNSSSITTNSSIIMSIGVSSVKSLEESKKEIKIDDKSEKPKPIETMKPSTIEESKNIKNTTLPIKQVKKVFTNTLIYYAGTYADGYDKYSTAEFEYIKFPSTETFGLKDANKKYQFDGEAILLDDGKYLVTPDTPYLISNYIDPKPDFKTYINETLSFNRYNPDLNEYQYFSSYGDFINIPADLIKSNLKQSEICDENNCANYSISGNAKLIKSPDGYYYLLQNDGKFNITKVRVG